MRQATAREIKLFILSVSEVEAELDVRFGVWTWLWIDMEVLDAFNLDIPGHRLAQILIHSTRQCSMGSLPTPHLECDRLERRRSALCAYETL